MVKREFKRGMDRYGRLFEPLFIFLLILVFVFPILTVLNLTPETGLKSVPQKDVLGVLSENDPVVELVGGKHNFISMEKLINESRSSYRYYTTLLQREGGVYSKPILRIFNPSDESVVVRLLILNNETSSTDIGIVNQSELKSLKSSTGDKEILEYEVRSGEEIILHLDIRNQSPTNFNESFDLRIDLINLKEEIEIVDTPTPPVDQTDIIIDFDSEESVSE